MITLPPKHISSVLFTSLNNIYNKPIIYNENCSGIFLIIITCNLKEFKKFFPNYLDETQIKNDFTFYKNIFMSNTTFVNNPFLNLHNHIKHYINTTNPIFIIPYYKSLYPILNNNLLHYDT